MDKLILIIFFKYFFLRQIKMDFDHTKLMGGSISVTDIQTQSQDRWKILHLIEDTVMISTEHSFAEI